MTARAHGLGRVDGGMQKKRKHLHKLQILFLIQGLVCWVITRDNHPMPSPTVHWIAQLYLECHHHLLPLHLKPLSWEITAPVIATTTPVENAVLVVSWEINHLVCWEVVRNRNWKNQKKIPDLVLLVV
jgi:hypothetical protein